jgi:TonB family protein
MLTYRDGAADGAIETTMPHQELETTQNQSKWYVIASQGNVVVRVLSGMTLGETAAGELSFKPSDAQFELNIDDDGSLLVSAIRGDGSDSSAQSPAHHERLVRGSRAEIALPHHNLQLNTEFLGFTRTKDTVRIRESADPVAAGRHTSADIPSPGTMEPALAPPAPQVRNHYGLPQIQRVPRGPTPAPKTLADRADKDQRPEPDARRRGRPVLATAVILLVTVSIVSLLQMRDRSEQTNALKSVDDAAMEAAMKASSPVSSTDTKVNSSAESSVGVSVEQVPEPPAASDSATPIFTPIPIEDAMSWPASEQQPATAQTNESVEPVDLAEEPVKRGTAIGSQPTEPAAAVARRAPAPMRESSAQLARERDLLAAELALVRDQLIAPRETSAFALFSRVLQRYPDSPEAQLGLQAVREKLINRTFAQLAEGAWIDAAATLEAAEEAGADPQLVIDLRNEVDYRLQLAEAEAGRFETLYPSEQLVVISREVPALRRGSVEVEFTVTGQGDVRDIEILGNPPRRSANAVRRAVADWRFEPVLESGRPLPVRTRMSVGEGS